MQTEIMKDSLYVVFFQSFNQSRSFLNGITHQIEHMGIVSRIFRDIRETENAFVCERLQLRIVLIPKLFPLALDCIQILQLGPKESCRNITWKKRTSRIAPAIFVYLASIELSPVCPFLPNYFSAAHETFVINNEKSPFPGYDILRFMKKRRRQNALSYPKVAPCRTNRLPAQHLQPPTIHAVLRYP